MVSGREVRQAVRIARKLLKDHGYDVKTRTHDLVLWFKAETPYEDSSLEDILQEPLLVVHELVEIELVKMMGLRLTKKVIVNNLEAVDRAHLEATRTELDIAAKIGARSHLRERIPDIKAWISDPSVTGAQKEEYRKLLRETTRSLQRLDAPVRT